MPVRGMATQDTADKDLARALELLADAYEEWGDEGHPTNRWRYEVERLGAWPRKPTHDR